MSFEEGDCFQERSSEANNNGSSFFISRERHLAASYGLFFFFFSGDLRNHQGSPLGFGDAVEICRDMSSRASYVVVNCLKSNYSKQT